MRRLMLTLFFLAASCVHQTTVSTTVAPAPPPGPNELSGVERVLGWQLLFDGHSLAGWHGLGFSGAPATWTVDSGAIKRVPPTAGTNSNSAQVDLVSDSTYSNFEL